MYKYQEIFDRYMSLMSNEMKEGILGYEKLSETVALPPQASRIGAIKVLFKNGGWIRVYETFNGGVEWY